MATAFRLISEAESSKFTGVSLDTIRQYERFGLLQSVRKGNDIFYRENDLKAVFAVTGSQETNTPGQASESIGVERSTATKAPEQLANNSTEAIDQQTARSESATSPSVQPSVTAPESVEPAQASSKGASFAHTETPTAESATSPGPRAEENREEDKRTEESRYHTTATRAHSETYRASQDSPKQLRLLTSIPDEPHDDDYPPQYAKANPQGLGMFEIMESNRTLREQIEILKDERDWLRKRVEKLETRSERDQMILIAENETVKGLINQLDKPKKSFWSFSLPWLSAPK